MCKFVRFKESYWKTTNVEQLEKLKDTEQDDSVAEKISTRNWNKAIQNAISIVKKGGAK